MSVLITMLWPLRPRLSSLWADEDRCRNSVHLLYVLEAELPSLGPQITLDPWRVPAGPLHTAGAVPPYMISTDRLRRRLFEPRDDQFKVLC